MIPQGLNTVSAGDIPYPIVDSRDFCIMIRRGDGVYWDFPASRWDLTPTAPFDPKRLSLPLTRDKLFPLLQIGSVPLTAANEPTAIVIQALSKTFTGKPLEDFAMWIGPGPVAGVPTLNFTGGTITLK